MTFHVNGPRAPKLPPRHRLLTAAMFVFIHSSLAGTVAVAQTPPAADAMCMVCHAGPQTSAVLNSVHGVKTDTRTPFANQGCVSCHGASTEHIQGGPGGRPAPDIRFNSGSPHPAVDTSRQNQVCLDCHQADVGVNWHAGQHQFEDLGCASCHTIHAIKDPVLDKVSQSAVCFTCHAQQQAESHRPYGHPLRVGTMACTDCHQPHGSAGTAMLVKNTVNETCYQCHAEKRGPHLWEHQPVREDCTLCHAPHGSTQPSLLTMREPFLCNACHAEDRHPGTLRSGTGLPPTGADANLLGSSCTSCHSRIHGSNHPSGPGLTR